MNAKFDTQHESVTFQVNGDLVSTTVESVRDEVVQLLEGPGDGPWNLFRLDLRAAKMIDSKGLNLIVSLLKRLQKRPARLQVLYSDANVQRTFTFTRLDKHVELVKG